MDHTIKYIQLDFLRLFRLCREIGAIGRKRKVPIDYNEPKKAIHAGRRLLKILITFLFPNFQMTNRNGIYFVNVPHNIRNDFMFINNRHEEYFNLLGEEGRNIQDLYADLKSHRNGFIRSFLPSEFRIYAQSYSIMSEYNIAVSNGAICRPREEFYRCAKTILEYKNIWDNNVEKIREFVERELSLTNQRNAQLAETQREQRQRENAQHTARACLEQQVRVTAQTRLNNAQSLFNNALEEYRRRNNAE